MDANLKIEEIRYKLYELFEKNPIIHVSIVDGRKKVKSAPSRIKGAYPNFICVESEVDNYMESFTINYRDVMIKRIIIDELNN